MKEIINTYDLDGTKVTRTVVRVTARMGIERVSKTIAMQKLIDEKEIPEDFKFLAVVAYPDVLSATTKVEGMEWPVTFDQFIDLPEELLDDWLTDVYTANPHWNRIPVAEDQKKSSRKS